MTQAIAFAIGYAIGVILSHGTLWACAWWMDRRR
jgi:hypothetical protein